MEQFKVRMEKELPAPGKAPAIYRSSCASLERAIDKARETAGKAIRSGKYANKPFAVFVDWIDDKQVVQPGVFGITGGMKGTGEKGQVLTEYVSVNPVTLRSGGVIPAMMKKEAGKYAYILQHTPEHRLLVINDTLQNSLITNLESIVPNSRSEGNRPWAIQIQRISDEGNLQDVCAVKGRGFANEMQLEELVIDENCTEEEKDILNAVFSGMEPIETAAE